MAIITREIPTTAPRETVFLQQEDQECKQVRQVQENRKNRNTAKKKVSRGSNARATRRDWTLHFARGQKGVEGWARQQDGEWCESLSPSRIWRRVICWIMTSASLAAAITLACSPFRHYHGKSDWRTPFVRATTTVAACFNYITSDKRHFSRQFRTQSSLVHRYRAGFQPLPRSQSDFDILLNKGLLTPEFFRRVLSSYRPGWPLSSLCVPRAPPRWDPKFFLKLKEHTPQCAVLFQF